MLLFLFSAQTAFSGEISDEIPENYKFRFFNREDAPNKELTDLIRILTQMMQMHVIIIVHKIMKFKALQVSTKNTGFYQKTNGFMFTR